MHDLLACVKRFYDDLSPGDLLANSDGSFCLVVRVSRLTHGVHVDTISSPLGIFSRTFMTFAEFSMTVLSVTPSGEVRCSQ